MSEGKAMKTMTRFAALLGLLVLMTVGCQAPPSWNYIVTVDTAFSPDFVSAVVDAASNWQSMVGERLTLTFNFGGVCSGDGNEICVHASTHQAIVAMGSNGSTSNDLGLTETYPSGHADIYIPVAGEETDTPSFKAEIIGHELGHAFGLQHITSGNLMCAGAGCAVPLPTCSDIAQFMSIRISSGWGWQGNKSCPKGATFTLSGK
jgi:hypothetical protein